MATTILIVILISLFITGIIAILAVLTYPIVKDNQCPQCHRFWAAKRMQEEHIGIFDKGIYLYPAFSLRKMRIKHWGVNRFEKYAVHCQCRYCEHQWHLIKIQEL